MLCLWCSSSFSALYCSCQYAAPAEQVPTYRQTDKHAVTHLSRESKQPNTETTKQLDRDAAQRQSGLLQQGGEGEGEEGGGGGAGEGIRRVLRLLRLLCKLKYKGSCKPTCGMQSTRPNLML